MGNDVSSNKEDTMKLNFVFVSLQRINTDRESTSTSIAKELSRHHRVLYVNPPIDRKAYLLGTSDRFINEHLQFVRHEKHGHLYQMAENLWVLNPGSVIESINWIPNTPIFQYFNKRNNRRFAKEIRKAVDDIGFEDFVLINDKDIYRSFFLKELLTPLLYAYLDRDYIIAMDYWKRHGSILEPLLMAKSDLVLCNSPGFTKRASQYATQAHYIGNGCDITVFDANTAHLLPSDLSAIKSKPIIGYVGALTALRLDINLLIFLAESRPEWSFVFVGPEDKAFQHSKLHALDNTHFLGKKESAEAPAYMQHFDICINPQLINEITDDNYPLKIDEYLAMGKPVVATATTIMQEVFHQVVGLAASKQEFLAELEKALESDTDEKRNQRIAMAATHSWPTITEHVLRIIKDQIHQP